MSARSLRPKLLNSLDAMLKPRGFVRLGATYFRDREDFGERFAIVGNRWNSGAEPWELYVDVGVHFAEAPVLVNGQGLWRHSHAIGSADRLLDQCPPMFLLRATNIDEVAAEIAEVIVRVSETLSAVIEPARERARRGLLSPLPVPTNWIDAHAS